MIDSSKSVGVSKRDVDRVSKFLEELGWLLRSFSDVNLSAISQVSQLATMRNALAHNSFDSIGSSTSSSMMLVGVLPTLFIDETVFPQNEDIAEFALEALHVRVPRWQKKSKYEIIGHIVCNASKLDDREINGLVHALNLLVRNDRKARNVVRERHEAGLSWSETIQMINRER